MTPSRPDHGTAAQGHALTNFKLNRDLYDTQATVQAREELALVSMKNSVPVHAAHNLRHKQ